MRLTQIPDSFRQMSGTSPMCRFSVPQLKSALGQWKFRLRKVGPLLPFAAHPNAAIWAGGELYGSLNSHKADKVSLSRACANERFRRVITEKGFVGLWCRV